MSLCFHSPSILWRKLSLGLINPLSPDQISYIETPLKESCERKLNKKQVYLVIDRSTAVLNLKLGSGLKVFQIIRVVSTYLPWLLDGENHALQRAEADESNQARNRRKGNTCIIPVLLPCPLLVPPLRWMRPKLSFDSTDPLLQTGMH